MVEKNRYSRFLDKVAEAIDIPPSKYQDAVDRYQAVGKYLEDGEYPGCAGELSIYPQGSFRLGTVVRPIRDGVEASYDIDLVCELPIEKHWTNPRSVKLMVGNRLKEHGTYRKLLDEEGKRCWTLEYAEQDEIGFHLDVLPSVPDPRPPLDTAIAITNKQGNVYTWSASDPKGYGLWFDRQNQAAFEFARTDQKRAILAQSSHIYASIDDVPDALVRTPLQRSIQLMKRHRDIMFDNEQNNKHSPISIIITTLAAQFYQNESDIYSALYSIVNQLHAHAVLVENGTVNRSLAPHSPIKRMPDGGWYIGNPVNPKENFADRWQEDNHARARAFFHWVAALKEALFDILEEPHLNVLRERLSATLGAAVVSKHFDLIASGVAAESSVPRIHISKSTSTRPWRA